jgi:hypothetical protein
LVGAWLGVAGGDGECGEGVGAVGGCT